MRELTFQKKDLVPRFVLKHPIGNEQITKIELVLAKRPKGPRTKNNTAQKCQVETLIALCNVAQCVQVQCVQYKRPTTRHRIILIRDWSKFLY